MIGTTVSHYRILEHLGGGGMGVVYKAEDLKLKRTVALKFLPAEWCTDQDARERFLREARAASALDHPNICTIFEIDETDEGRLFIAMACYDGETVKQMITRGPLPIEEAVRIAIKTASGLQRAHAAGIIHRDIKPANLIVTTAGDVKILDFGLAKSAGQQALTRAGSTMGTPFYMSPEQARGAEVGPTTDIWSLGVVLYEMVTGTRPFEADNHAAIVRAILDDQPRLVRELRPDAPPMLERIIHRAMDKNAGQRHPSAEELIADLQALQAAESEVGVETVTTGGAGLEKPKPDLSIVVLPFDNLSPDPDQEFFSDGLTEEIISDLAKVRAMRVISRTSAMQLKGTTKDLKTIGRELNVRYVLEGSVRRAGNNLRITAQLIDAVTDIHLWAEKYTGTLDDIFDIQETVSRTIVDALKVELTPQEDRRIADRATENVDVFECYHRAHSDLQTWSLPGIQRARVDLEKGLETFGEHADLYFELGHAHVMAYDLGIEPTAETLQRAEECAKKGLQLGPESPRSHYLFGMIERSRGNTIQAIRYLERFLAMEPDSSDGLFWLGTMYTFAGRTGAGLRMARRLLQVDPLYARTHLALGLAYQADGKIEPALAAMEKNAFLEPESATPPFWIAITLLQNNEFQKASDLIDKFAPSVDKLERHFVEIALFARHAVRQEKDRAYSVLSDATRRFLWADPYLPWLVAGFFAVLGEHDESIRWLERLIELGFFNYPLLAEIDPTYESIRGDERFQRLMNEIKPKWESFEVGLDLSRYPPAE